MIYREQQIRELIARLTAPESKVSREFSVLSVDAAEFLLMQLDEARAGITLTGPERSLLNEMLEPAFPDAEYTPAALALRAKLKGTTA